MVSCHGMNESEDANESNADNNDIEQNLQQCETADPEVVIRHDEDDPAVDVSGHTGDSVIHVDVGVDVSNGLQTLGHLEASQIIETRSCSEDVSSMSSMISSLDDTSGHAQRNHVPTNQWAAAFAQDDENLLRFASRIPTRLRNSREIGSWNPSRARSCRWDHLGDPSLASSGLAGIPPSTLQYYSGRSSAPLYEVEAPPSSEEEELRDPSDHIEALAHLDVSSDAMLTAVQDPEDIDSKTQTPNVSPYTHTGCTNCKYESYACVVDSTQGDRSIEIQLGSFARPHMRAFHMAWFAFFVAFFTWFALTPLLSEIAASLNLSKEQIWTSSIYGVAGSAVTRILIGPICDKYGSRWSMAGTLILSAIPTAVAGLVQTSQGLNVVRLFIGIAGSAFVTCQYWTSSMFTREVAGTANALVAGWGNLGGGVTQIVMGSILFPLLKLMYGGVGWTHAENGDDNDAQDEQQYDRAANLAWRTSVLFPALLCLVTAYFVIRKSDDCPKGNYGKRYREGLMSSVSARQAIMCGIRNLNTWVLFIQYGCCFGVEITMVNAAALYFKEEFGLSTESAAAIASIFGWMNLFARGVGGFLSDIASSKFGMRGRLWIQVITLLMEGALVLVFSTTQKLGSAIVVMIFFSIFVQAAEGSTYGIVPYVNPPVTGSIAGIVGAGGNVGGVGFATLFREYDYRNAFYGMGWAVMASAFLTTFISIQGHGALCCGSDAPEVIERRKNHTEELGDFPSVMIHEHDTSKRSSTRDPDPSNSVMSHEHDTTSKRSSTLDPDPSR